MKNIFSMDDPDYQKHKLFDPIITLQTYFNLLYALIELPLYLLIVLPLYLLFLTGIVLLPIFLGTPLLNLSFTYARLLLGFNNRLFRIILREEIPKMDSQLPPPGSRQIQLLKFLLTNNKNWKRLFYFLLQPFLSIISLVLLTFTVGLAFLMIYSPVNAIFGHINIFGFFQTDSFIDAIFAFFIGFILFAGLLHLINLWIKAITHFTIFMTGR